MPDVNFDPLAERFAQRIYGNAKGELRQRLVWRDMLAHLPIHSGQLAQPLTVWDAGGGMGQVSFKLAELGHSVLLTDISQNMLECARHDSPVVQQRVSVARESILDVANTGRQFNLVVCHAVLEWLETPLAALPQLVSCIAPGGYLSLMFYNSNALVLGNMIKGNYHKLMSDQLAGDKGGLTPPNPLDPHRVIDALEKLAVVTHKRGVRLGHDVLRRELRGERSLDDMEALDWKYGAQEPWWQLGRYVHVIAERRM